MSVYDSLDMFDVQKHAVDDEVFDILRRILMNVWHYSENHAQKVFFFAQKSEENSYGIDVLLKVMDGYYEIHELNNADTDFKFDVSSDRQRYLYQMISEIFGHQLLPYLVNNKYNTPSSIQASWSLAGNVVEVSFGYGETAKTLQSSLTEWKDALINPEKAIDFIEIEGKLL